MRLSYFILSPMNRRLTFLATLFCCLASFGFIWQDDDPLKTLLDKLSQYKRKNPQEKVHLHTDKPYYSIGDSIWLKAYVVNADDNRLSGLSKILYVDLINEKDSIKKSLRLALTSGLGIGDFVLSDSLSEGNYRLRAYTTWMRNFGEEFYFDKTIQIGNALSNQIYTSVNYSFSKTGIKEHVTADIIYQDINGSPLSNKEVKYFVQLDFRSIASGKGMTDDKGRIQVKFTNTQPFILKSGKINTSVKLDESTSVNKTFPIKATTSEIDLQFFPESGNLISGIRTKVGFKAVGSDGLSREVSGTIIDKNNNSITVFSSEHAGMGTFSLLPEAGNTYKAIIKSKDGAEKQAELPKVQAEGYMLSVTETNSDSMLVRIFLSNGLSGQGDLTLIAQNNGLIEYISKTKLSNSSFSTMLPKKRFPEGILQFTLFSPSMQPVAERLTFIEPTNFKVEIASNKATYSKRQKVELNFSARDSSVAGLISNFSVSVINESLVPFDDLKETTILSNLLLSSDLKGYVENPNYYFIDNNPQRKKHLDNLLLTQGWRRYNWGSIITNSYPGNIFPPEQDITIRGRVVNPNGTPVVGGKVVLLPSKGNGVIMDTLTNADGRFNFPGLSFNDSTTFVIQARSAKGKKKVYIEIDQIPPQLVTRNKNSPSLEINVNQNLMDYLKSRQADFETMRKNGLLRKSIMLAEVKIAEKKPVLTNSSNLNGAGNADAIIKADKLQDCLNLTQCLQGMVAGIIIQNGIAYSTRSMYSSFSGLVPMQLVIDGVYVEPEYLSMVVPQDVESIEVLKSIGNTAIYGIRGGGGVLIINTKRGERNLSYRNLSPGVATYKPLGLFTAREFYSPVYTVANINSVQINPRSTIFWKPSITTTTEGKASVSFFTDDDPGTYKIVAEGLNMKGQVFRSVHRFTVH